ncbi:MAG: hypothetical protein L0Y56_02590, partial [Nitrospira sp.]|nr:hypothetical protein [Nitrospira sp.]
MGKEALYEVEESFTQRIVRSATNRERFTSEDGMLFSVEMIERKAVFTGRITGPANKIQLFLKEIFNAEQVSEQKSILLSIGGATSRGLGRIRLEISPAQTGRLPGPREAVLEKLFPPDRVEQILKLPELHQRILGFNETLKQFKGKVRKEAGSDNQYLSMSLLSDTILYDRTGRPLLSLDKEAFMERLIELQSNLKESMGTLRFKKVRSYGTPTHYSGWSAAWRLPKEVFVALESGSLFIYKVEG